MECSATPTDIKRMVSAIYLAIQYLCFRQSQEDLNSSNDICGHGSSITPLQLLIEVQFAVTCSKSQALRFCL